MCRVKDTVVVDTLSYRDLLFLLSLKKPPVMKCETFESDFLLTWSNPECFQESLRNYLTNS